MIITHQLLVSYQLSGFVVQNSWLVDIAPNIIITRQMRNQQFKNWDEFSRTIYQSSDQRTCINGTKFV